MSDFKDRFFQSKDGLTLYARDYSGPEADSPTLLCLHGLTRNSRDFQDVAPALASDFRVVVPEQRGRGRSEYAADVAHYALMQYVEDTRALIEGLGVDQVSIIGTSMGGLMTFALSALYPGSIKKAVINDIGPHIATVGLERIKSYVGVPGPFADWQEATDYLADISSEIFPDWDRDQWSRFACQCYVEREGQVVIDYDPRIAEPLAGDSQDTETEILWSLFDTMVGVPMLLIRGDLTDLLTEECTAEMLKRHPQCELLRVPNVGHAPMLTEPGVPEAIQRFLLA